MQRNFDQATASGAASGGAGAPGDLAKAEQLRQMGAMDRQGFEAQYMGMHGVMRGPHHPAYGDPGLQGGLPDIGSVPAGQMYGGSNPLNPALMQRNFPPHRSLGLPETSSTMPVMNPGYQGIPGAAAGDLGSSYSAHLGRQHQAGSNAGLQGGSVEVPENPYGMLGMHGYGRGMPFGGMPRDSQFMLNRGVGAGYGGDFSYLHAYPHLMPPHPNLRMGGLPAGLMNPAQHAAFDSALAYKHDLASQPPAPPLEARYMGGAPILDNPHYLSARPLLHDPLLSVAAMAHRSAALPYSRDPDTSTSPFTTQPPASAQRDAYAFPPALSSGAPAKALRAKAGAGAAQKRVGKRAREASQAGSGGGEKAAKSGAAQGGEVESAMSGDSQSVVLKRLEQNRNSARKSRERKRVYKEHLLQQIPGLKKVEEEMNAALECMIQSVQDSVTQLLSPKMQALVTKQWQYFDECKGLARLLEVSDNERLDEAMGRANELWKQLLQAQESAANGTDSFTLLSGKHMAPSHRMWLWMGGLRMSLIVRTFLRVCSGTILSEVTRAVLTRQVECWCIQEEMLERGKARWSEMFVECCVGLVQSRHAVPPGHVVPQVSVETLGKMDAMTMLLRDGIQLRRIIMDSLRRQLTQREHCLLLVVQAMLMDRIKSLTAWCPSVASQQPLFNQGAAEVPHFASASGASQSAPAAAGMSASVQPRYSPDPSAATK